MLFGHIATAGTGTPSIPFLPGSSGWMMTTTAEEKQLRTHDKRHIPWRYALLLLLLPPHECRAGVYVLLQPLRSVEDRKCNWKMRLSTLPPAYPISLSFSSPFLHNNNRQHTRRHFPIQSTPFHNHHPPPGDLYSDCRDLVLNFRADFVSIAETFGLIKRTFIISGWCYLFVKKKDFSLCVWFY